MWQTNITALDVYWERIITSVSPRGSKQAYVVEISMTFYGEKKQALYEND